MTASFFPATGAADLTVAAELVARNFLDLPYLRYAVPDDERRLPVLRGVYRIMVDHAADGNGAVVFTADRSGVAVWFDLTRPFVAPRDYEGRLTRAADGFADRFQALDTVFGRHHPAEPHWHLALIAVRPESRGHGVGGSLLAHTHARLDREGIPAYLEATGVDSRRMYQRHGYEPMSPAAVRLPGGARFHRMWRPARPGQVRTGSDPGR